MSDDWTERRLHCTGESRPRPLCFYGIICGVKGLSRSGQAALEYVLALASLLVVVGLLAGLVGAAGRHAARTESLVAGDCP
ncbi:MAG: hypothetical protein IJG84_03825 [Kiritimatiellae bacterium]|nr:hypothetical protein [Kiritimatiellia bacterium]